LSNTQQLEKAESVSPAPRFRNVVHLGKFYAPHVGGIESHLQVLCTELSKSMKVGVLVASDSNRNEESVIDGVSVSRHRKWINLAGAPICPSMVKMLRRPGMDLVHLHLPNPAAVLSVLASGYNGPTIATWHSDVVRQKRLGRLFAPIQRYFLRHCKAIITTSLRYADSSSDLAPFRSKCSVVPYGLPINQYRSVESSAIAAIRKAYGSPIVLAVGRLVYYKGFEHLIRAMRKIAGRLLIIGDGPLRGSLEELARALGIADRVVFVGEKQSHEIGPYYHGCDVFALPSIARSEAFGIVQLEAMACARPVVNTQLDSGVPFVSIHGKTGLTVPPHDSEALAKAINTLLHDDELRKHYGQAARRRVEAEFGLSKMLQRTLRVYSQVASDLPLRGR
jgi:glycosyltransferase involved in cell wall biosynthesis